MKLIIGLGNLGSKYAVTRHNAGRSLVEYIARQFHLKFSKKSRLGASMASWEWEGCPVTLAYPETFMNVSGEAVGGLVRFFKCDPERDLLVVVDDTALPFGGMRLRPRGSDGGHNGLKSVTQHLGSSNYARLRLGIGMGLAVMSLESYVLSPFSTEECEIFPCFLARGLEACQLWIGRSTEDAMNAVNSYPPIS